MSEDKKKCWYVVHAQSGYENYVLKELQRRVAHEKIEDLITEIVIPSETVVELRGGSKRETSRKFFPGYVLVRMVMNDFTWHLIRRIPKVMGFIGGTAQTPVPISDTEADQILQKIEEGATKPKPKVLFEPGEVVRVKEGPFADFTGSVEKVNYDKSKIKVAVVIFGRATPVELDFSQVEKA